MTTDSTTKTDNPRIITLTQAVANRIAAGEVVERPAAVLKELIENSLDAHAKRITVVIENAGRTLIRVVDDGIGMSESDLTVAICRHSTSKLSRFEDLETLSTFGFRGEALPSIAAVSRLELVSRTRDSDMGTRIKISGGSIDKVEPIAAPQGTSISVSHLFYNVPARRKFLRTDGTEFKWIATTFRHYALAFPELTWELYRRNEPVYKLEATDNPLKRLAEFFGDDVAEDMIKIDFQNGWLKITGWISPAEFAQRTTADQFTFLNRRPIYHPGVSRIMSQACQDYYNMGGHPIYVLHLQAAPDRFDINVHPAKKEVKFSDEQGVKNAVWAAVRKAFSAASSPLTATDQMQKSTESGYADSVTRRVSVAAPPHLTPYVSIPRKHGEPLPFPGNESNSMTEPPHPSHSVFDPTSLGESDEPNLFESEEKPTIWQVHDTYILSPLKKGLIIIDQHVAHERVLYERALQAIERTPWTSQQLLFTPTFSVAPEDVSRVKELIPLLNSMGFAIESSGLREFRLIAAPAGIKIANERDMVLDIIHDYIHNEESDQDPRMRIAASFACRGAIKAGQPLQPDEMRLLIDELFRTQDPEFCPHGRPVYKFFSLRDIDKMFGR